MIILLILLCLMTGCVNIVYHAGNEVDNIYAPTRDVWDQGVCIWWNKKAEALDPIGTAWIKLTYPLWVVDFPLEVVSDTITLPYDYYMYKKVQK